MSKEKSIESLVDEMIDFTKSTGGTLDMYVAMCEKSVEEAKDNLNGSDNSEKIYKDSLEFLRIAELRLEEEEY